MGIYDRDYERERSYDREPGFHLRGDWTLTTKLVLLMFVIYLVQVITRGEPPVDGRFTDLMSLHSSVIKQPWRVFEFLTYGFVHDPWRLQHIVFNMIALWFFGRSVEGRYGRREYIAFFLVAVVFAGVAWLVCDVVANGGVSRAQMLGASGAIAAVLVVFCLNFPRELVYIWGVLPIPAWVFAIVFIGMDVIGAMGHSFSKDNVNVAYTAHLGGALFGFLYYQSGLSLERFLPGRNFVKRLKPRPKLRVLDPNDAEELDNQVNEILKKIQEHGRDSLTRGERRVLEQASREYQKRRGE